LITVAAYDIAGSRIIVPQRIEPDHTAPEPAIANGNATKATQPSGQLTSGADAFFAAIETSPETHHAELRRLAEWAVTLEREGLVNLATFKGISNRFTLLPRLVSDNAGLVTIWNDGGAYLQFWRSVFERRAPQALPRVEALIAPGKVGQGTTTRIQTNELLGTLTAAYREAAQASLQPAPDTSPSLGNEEG
jgi:hypothetical protein